MLLRPRAAFGAILATALIWSCTADSGHHDALEHPASNETDVQVPGPTCDVPLSHPPLRVCVASRAIALGSDPMGQQQLKLALTAEVLEVGAGPIPADCVKSGYLGTGDPAPEDQRWLRIEDASGVDAVIGVGTPGFEWPVATGDSVALTYWETRVYSPFAPLTAAVELRTLDDRLLAWFGFAGSVAELQPPPEIALSQAAAVCRNRLPCSLMWTQYDLRVEVGADALPLGYGQRATIGPLTITHYGVDVESDSEPLPVACGEGTLRSARVTAWTP